MKTSRRLLAVLLALSVLPLAQVLYPGCATLSDGVTQTMRVKSKPVGAQVFLNGHAVGKTPVTITMSRWRGHRLRLELAGFEPYDLPLERSFNANAGWNFYMGIAPIMVDAVSGAIFEHRVPKAQKDELLKSRWEDGDDAYMRITVGLHPLGPARKIGQMERRKK